VRSADDFYCVMSDLMRDALRGELIEGDDLIRTSYKLAPLPFPNLNQLREKYTYNITPFAGSEGMEDACGKERGEVK